MQYKTLITLQSPGRNARLALPSPDESCGLSPSDPAEAGMADFRRGPAVTIEADSPLDRALECMVQAGVRLLFVRDAAHQLVGMITAYDIQGEKPMRYMQSIDCSRTTCAFSELRVRDVMDPLADWQVAQFEAIRKATIADVVDALHVAGRHHLVVTERDRQSGVTVIRGLFSASWLSRQLGVSIEPERRAHSFVELEQTLTSRH